VKTKDHAGFGLSAFRGNNKVQLKEGQMTQFDFALLAENWPAPIVSRSDILRFTGGLISQRYIANLDSKGLGPKERVRCGRRVGYPVDVLVEWLRNRSRIESLCPTVPGPRNTPDEIST
jgi:hypothetical protein